MTEEGILEGEFKAKEAEAQRKSPAAATQLFWRLYVGGLAVIGITVFVTDNYAVLLLAFVWAAFYLGIIEFGSHIMLMPTQICGYFDAGDPTKRCVTVAPIKLLHDHAHTDGEYRLQRGDDVPAAFRDEGERLVRNLLNLTALAYVAVCDAEYYSLEVEFRNGLSVERRVRAWRMVQRVIADALYVEYGAKARFELVPAGETAPQEPEGAPNVA